MATDSLPLGITGIAASLRFWYFNAAGSVYNATTGLFETWDDANYAHYKVGGVTEQGTTGRYSVTTPTPVAALESFTFEVHRTVGGTPSTDTLVGEGAEEGDEGVTPQTGTTLPATRTLRFERWVGGVLTDPDANTV